MLKKTITYTDYEGNERTEDFYFNLNKAEVIKWLTMSGGYTIDKLIQQLAQKNDGKQVLAIFEDLVRISYGEKSLDGRRFIKNDDIWKNFEETEAYSQLFVDLIGDSAKAAEFVNGIIPNEMADEIDKIVKDNPDGIPAEIKDYLLNK